MTIFTKHFILDVWQGSKCASGLLNFCHGSKRNIWEGWYLPNWWYYSLQTENIPLFWSQTWKYIIQANQGLMQIKEKWLTIKFDVSVFSFLFFVLFFVRHKLKWYVLFFYRHQTSDKYWHVHMQPHTSNGRDWSIDLDWTSISLSFIFCQMFCWVRTVNFHLLLLYWWLIFLCAFYS